MYNIYQCEVKYRLNGVFVKTLLNLTWHGKINSQNYVINAEGRTYQEAYNVLRDRLKIKGIKI
jgi:hypothetical protein